MYYSHRKKNCGYLEFLEKRFRRVYIPYIIIVLITFFIPFIDAGIDRVKALLSHVFLYKMFFNSYIRTFGPQLWFVSTIVQFCLLFPVLCYLKEKLQDKFIYISIFVSAGWMLLSEYVGGSTKVWYACFLTFLWIFVLGMFFADKIINYSKIEIKLKYPLLFCGIVSFISICIYGICGMYQGGATSCLE